MQTSTPAINMPARPSPSARRRLDAESGMNRVSSGARKSRRQPPPPEPESDEYISSDSELESELEMPAKDDSRRRKPAPPPPARKGKADGRSRAFKGEQDDNSDLVDQKEKDTGNSVAPHRQVLLAATYHVGISSISRPSVSSFIPSCSNYYQMIFSICSVLTDNSLVHELNPAFLSIVVYLYYGHVFYYHVLRARAAAGSDVLTRLEKRVLTFYERVAPPESWPIAAPLLGFLEYFGAHKTEDPYYGWIVPKLPDFGQLNSTNCLRNINAVPGSSRVPLIPALQKFLFNFGNGTASFVDNVLYPLDTVTLSDAEQFCGINASTAISAPFQTLAFNQTWLAPTETGDTIGPFDYDVKHARIRRWNVPDVPNNADLRTLPSFLGFTDDASFDWMKHLLSTAEIVNRFFPGSGNLSQVPPLTTIGVATLTAYHRQAPVNAENDFWYPQRSGLRFAFKGFTNTEPGLIDTKMALTVSSNAIYSNHVIPALANHSAPGMSGPFFEDDADRINNHETRAVPVTEGFNQLDPARRFLELATSLYDNRAGRQ